MIGSAPLYRRIRRRETNSPRSTLAIVLAVIVILVCAWAIAEIVLRLVGQPPLIATLPQVATSVVDVPRYPIAAVIAIGAAAAVVGLLLVIAAIVPGRLARHVIQTDHSAAIVDDEVIASALARHAARAAGISPDNTRVTVSRRLAVVRLVPASGIPIDRMAATAAVDQQIADYRLSPALSSRILIADSGKVGS